jgi:hypothetical protein
MQIQILVYPESAGIFDYRATFNKFKIICDNLSTLF